LIIDSENSIDELNENNNNVIISYTRIDVKSPPSIFNPIPIVIGVLALVGIISVIGLIVRSTVRKIPDLNYREFSYSLFEERRGVVSQEYKRGNSLKIPRFCTSCGTEIVKGSLFCYNCGKDIEKIFQNKK